MKVCTVGLTNAINEPITGFFPVDTAKFSEKAADKIAAYITSRGQTVIKVGKMFVMSTGTLITDEV